jgi:hypothetical protein
MKLSTWRCKQHSAWEYEGIDYRIILEGAGQGGVK